jgi:hypothetical protein
VNHPVLLRAAQFQAALYFALLLAVILFLVVLGTVYALLGARGMWRSGERGPAAALAAAVVLAFIAVVGMYAVGIGGLLRVGGGS